MDILICGNNKETRDMKMYLGLFSDNIEVFVKEVCWEKDFDELVNRYDVFEDHLKPDPFDLVIDLTETKLSHAIINHICMKFKILVL